MSYSSTRITRIIRESNNLFEVFDFRVTFDSLPKVKYTIQLNGPTSWIQKNLSCKRKSCTPFSHFIQLCKSWTCSTKASIQIRRWHCVIYCFNRREHFSWHNAMQWYQLCQSTSERGGCIDRYSWYYLTSVGGSDNYKNGYESRESRESGQDTIDTHSMDSAFIGDWRLYDHRYVKK